MTFLVLDQLVSDVAPIMIYGTSDIDTVPMMIKRAVLMIVLTWTNGPYNDWLQTKL